MSKQVPMSVIEETKLCPHDFACLSTGQCGDPAKCKVSYANGNNVLILKSDEDISCPYRNRFGSRQLCTCPVHFALYQQKLSVTREPEA